MRPEAESAELFTARLAADLHARHPDWSVAPIAMLLVLVAEKNGATYELALDEPWRACRDAPSCVAARQGFVARVAPGGVVAPRVEPDPELQITPMVRSRQAIPPGLFVERPIAEGLVLLYLLGTPPDTRPARPEDLAALGRDEASLESYARRTLTAVLPPLSPDPPKTITVLSRGNDLEAGRLLLHESWREIAARTRGPLYVCAPSADTLLYTDGGNPTALPALVALANDMRLFASAPLPIIVLVWQPDGWGVVSE